MFAHRLEISISFGDCDPAGIAFYPNIFSWFDRTFHDWLRRFGGHGALCRQLDAVGIGLMDARAQFRRPMRDGDVLSLRLDIDKWGSNSLHLAYEGLVDGTIAVVGGEVRGLFKHGATGMFAAETDLLRKMLKSDGEER